MKNSKYAVIHGPCHTQNTENISVTALVRKCQALIQIYKTYTIKGLVSIIAKAK